MASPFIHERYDIGILRQDDTTKVGLMLVKDKNGNPRYQVFDDEYLASQFFTGTPGYGNLPPEKELAIRQDDWQAGFGLEVEDGSNNRYYSSTGMDMRFKGMGIAGQTPTTITLPTRTIGWVSPTDVVNDGWTNPTYAIDGSTSTGATITLTDATSGWLTVWLPVVSCDSIRFWWVDPHVGVGGDWIDIDLYYDNAWTAVLNETESATGEWVTVAIGATKNVTGARVRIHAAGAISTTGSIVEIQFNALDTTMGVVNCKAEFNDALYVSRGNSVLKMNAGGTAFTHVRALPEIITSMEPFTDDYLYIAQGLGGSPYYYMDTTATPVFTESDRTVHTFQYFKAVHAATPVLWGNDSANTIRSNANPDNAGDQWSSVTTIASSYDSITGLHSDAGALYITKEDLPYYLTSTGVVKNDLAPDLSSETKSTDNGRAANFWQGKFYLPWGDQTLLESDSGVNTFMNPADYCTNLTEFNGQVRAVAGDNRYLYAILDYSTSVEVLAGRYGVINSSVDWVWHPIAELTLTGCQTIWVSSVFQKRLYISSTSASDSLYYIPLFSGYGNVTTDANRLFKTGVQFVTPWLHGNFKSTDKAFPELELVMGHTFDANVGFQVQYQKLGDSAWTNIGLANTDMELTTGWTLGARSSTKAHGGTYSWKVSTTGLQTIEAYQDATWNDSYKSQSFTLTVWVWCDTAATALIVIDDGVTQSSSTHAGSSSWEQLTVTKTLSASATRLRFLLSVTGNTKTAYFDDVISVDNFTGTSTSMTQSRYIPNDSSSNHPVSTLFRLRFTAFTDSTNLTPILLSYHLKSILYPSQREVIACQVYCANELTLKDGTLDKGSFLTIGTVLDEARVATWPVTFYDIAGDTQTVKFLPLPSGTPRWEIMAWEKGRKEERIYNLLLQKVALS